MAKKKSKLNVVDVEEICEGNKLPISTLYDRLLNVIDEFDGRHGEIITTAEVIGTLEMVKSEYLKVE